MARPTALAPRLTSLEGARLGLFGTRPGGSSKATEDSVYALLDAIGNQLDTWFGLSSRPTFRRAVAGVRSPSEVLDEAAQACDAVVLGIGDCHHGSAANFTDVWELEARGVPVACIDTPRRTPRITKSARTFSVDYYRLDRRVKQWMRKGEDKLIAEFESQGLHRALRLAGARPGDTVRVGTTELELWPWPDSAGMAVQGTDGILHPHYIETAPLDTDHPETNAGRALELAARIASHLAPI